MESVIVVSGFERVYMNVDTVDWKGEPIRLKRVPVLKNKASGKIWHEPEEVAKAELRQLAETVGVEPRHLPLLLLFSAQPGPFQSGFLHNKYKLNKMLFYQWKELETIGLGEAFNHDEFEAAEKGPIPKHLYADLAELKAKGLIEVSGGPKERKTLTAELTAKGTKAANCLWNSAPPQYREISTKVKTRIFPLNPNTIMERVHKDFPEYRKIYDEPDKE